MQLSPRHTTAMLIASLGLTVASPGSAASMIDEQTTGFLMQLFSDSDKVTVRSAIGEYKLALAGGSALDLHWNNERVVIPGIEAAPGTQEATDAITTASRPISGNAFLDFVKMRNEFEGRLNRGATELGYYVSSETDYLGQQVSGSWNRDVMGDLLNLSFGGSYGWDAIDPVADDDTQSAANHKNTLHWNAIATRVVTATTLLRFGVEYNLVNGLQHNPYRNVYAGGTNVPERHPETRQRRDAFVKLHQYLPNQSSLKFHYRLYNDDWGIGSHEVGTALSQYITHGLFTSYEYRYYTQTAADFYRDEYAAVDGIDGFRSGDYRMAPLASHLFGVALDLDLSQLAAGTAVLGRSGVQCRYERYFNSNNYSANFLTTQINYRF
ncbi:MAG: DUF3570 domain-containing protein [Candidatus Eisenbacteria bacterium]|uniref:DUF3570 domain-containing protein n=1 Tax=Eiseniibacteriota bacterium TaxID=2212470 RepID=A0A849STY3_UNCEI|nr:DUF3570 domain-containing protein [Candidatus Eisenbacteria bacterium]